jgi:hypothetical protein
MKMLYIQYNADEDNGGAHESLPFKLNNSENKYFMEYYYNSTKLYISDLIKIINVLNNKLILSSIKTNREWIHTHDLTDALCAFSTILRELTDVAYDFESYVEISYS